MEVLEEAIRTLASVLGQGNKILLFGNGGSAADAQHIAAEFVNRYIMDRPPLPAIALTTDSSVLTAISNDFGYEEIFEKQIKALGNKGDAAVGIEYFRKLTQRPQRSESGWTEGFDSHRYRRPDGKSHERSLPLLRPRRRGRYPSHSGSSHNHWACHCGSCRSYTFWNRQREVTSRASGLT